VGRTFFQPKFKVQGAFRSSLALSRFTRSLRSLAPVAASGAAPRLGRITVFSLNCRQKLKTWLIVTLWVVRFHRTIQNLLNNNSKIMTCIFLDFCVVYILQGTPGKMRRLASDFSWMKEAVCDKIRKSNIDYCNHRCCYRPAHLPDQIGLKSMKKPAS